LVRVQPLGNSLFRPEFSGRRESTEDNCRLHGTFGFRDSAVVVMRAWLVSAVVLVITSAVISYRSQMPRWWLIPFGGLVVGLAGAMIFRFSRLYYRSDEAWLLNRIAGELRGVVELG
jgi:hypothetical protein